MVPAVEQQEANNDRCRQNARRLQNCFRHLGRVERGRTVDGGRRRCRKSYVQSVFHNQARRQGVPGLLPVTSSPCPATHRSFITSAASPVARGSGISESPNSAST